RAEQAGVRDAAQAARPYLVLVPGAVRQSLVSVAPAIPRPKRCRRAGADVAAGDRRCGGSRALLAIRRGAVVTGDWTEGYVADIGYTHCYTHELSPAAMRTALLFQGYAPPPESGFRYQELGFGQGLSINIHAASCDGAFNGIDFNPAQVAEARDLAAASGAEI